MRRMITFYFSFRSVVKGKNKEEIIITAERLAMEKLGKRCFEYCDDGLTNIEEVEE